jgi:tetratricopeptide (TPR) repeat protein
VVEGSQVAAEVRGLAEAGDGQGALALVAGVWREAWFSVGDVEGGSAAAAAALEAPGAERPSVDRARVLYADHLFAFRAGDDERARSRAEECLEVAGAADDLRGECDGFTGLARNAFRDGGYARTVELAREGRAKARAAGDRAAEAGPLHLEAAGTRLGGDYAGARELYTESLERARELGNEGLVANELHNLGWVALHLGEPDEAEKRFGEFERLANAAHHRPWLELNRAGVAVARGDLDEARSRLTAGEALIAEVGLTLDPDDQSEHDWLRAQVAETARS